MTGGKIGDKTLIQLTSSPNILADSWSDSLLLLNNRHRYLS